MVEPITNDELLKLHEDIDALSGSELVLRLLQDMPGVLSRLSLDEKALTWVRTNAVGWSPGAQSGQTAAYILYRYSSLEAPVEVTDAFIMNSGLPVGLIRELNRG